MVRVLLVADGASEPVHEGEPTSLERARTPSLDRVARAGRVARVATTPPGVRPGSETGLSVLLGAGPREDVSRGLLEARAAGVPVPEGNRAWRLDLRDPGGGRVPEATARAAIDALRAQLPEHAVRWLRGHRVLAVGEEVPHVELDDLDVVVWGDGVALTGPDLSGTLLISGPGAAVGVARTLGAQSIVPEGATGDQRTRLRAKRDAALRALANGVTRLVVHVGAPDEAAHDLDPDGKVAAVERIDRELVGALHVEVARRGGTFAVCSDHGTDPRTGHHDAGPVPCAVTGAGVTRDAVMRVTERRAARRPVVASPWTAPVWGDLPAGGEPWRRGVGAGRPA